MPSDPTATVERARAVLRTALDAMSPRLHGATGHDDPTIKADGTPVTETDLWVDRHLADAIGSAFPDHTILSEEHVTTFDGGPWTWIIDPIDGTANFTSGVPYWGVSVALAHHGEPVLGCVDAVGLGRRWEAVRGGGATCNDVPIRVAPAVDFRDGSAAHVPVLLTASIARRASRDVRLNPRILGAIAVDLCLVAEGSAAGAFCGRPHVWDVAAGSLIVTEAGGACLPLHGSGLLPLEPGADYAGRTTAYGAGPTLEFVRALAATLT